MGLVADADEWALASKGDTVVRRGRYGLWQEQGMMPPHAYALEEFPVWKMLTAHGDEASVSRFPCPRESRDFQAFIESGSPTESVQAYCHQFLLRIYSCC